MSPCCGGQGPPGLPRCREAERRLLAGLPSDLLPLEPLDTEITLPDGSTASLHSLELPGEEPPLVFLPGYGTGAAIWAPAWCRWQQRDSPLARRRRIALDPLGWYLSSRPRWTAGQDVEKAEAWFVDSFDAWRAARKIETMDLVGHSIGGYMATCYAEKHHTKVNRLLLVSPAGVPREPEDYSQRLRYCPWRMRLLLRFWGWGYTPLYALQCLPQSRGRMIAGWTARRWQSSARELDSEALADYIYHAWTEGHESGGKILPAILKPGAWAKKPLLERIPRLRIKHVEMMYGDRDWMDLRHGNAVATECSRIRQDEGKMFRPCTWVQLVTGSGHYLHLENVQGFTEAFERAVARSTATDDERTAAVPPGFEEHFSGPNVPKWRGWEGYGYGK